MDRQRMMDVSLLIIRLAIGIVFVAHGLQKVFGMFGGAGIEGFAGTMEALGFSQPLVWAWLIGLGELVGGIFLILGILPRLSSAVIAAIMVGAIVTIHGQNGYFAKGGGIEYQLFIIMVCLPVMLSGGGKFSVFDKL